MNSMSNHSMNGVRDLQKSATRARILARTKSLCSRHGFARTRTLDVARAAGISHGAVFAHFPSRERLIAAVVADMAREITDALHARVTAGGALRDVLEAHAACLAEHEEAYRWLLLESPLLPKGFHTSWLGLQSAVSSHI